MFRRAVTPRGGLGLAIVIVLLLGGIFVVGAGAAPASAVGSDPVDSEPTVVAVGPVRLLDTRAGASTFDGEHAGGGMVAAGQTVRVPIAGRGGVPESSVAVIANVTIVAPGAAGHATVYPCGAVPDASTLNYAAGKTVANSTFAGLDADGGLCVSTYAEAHVLVDVTAYLPNGHKWRPLVPARLLDSREGGTTIDGEFRQLSVTDGASVQITGRGGVSTHIGEPVSAVALNVTAIGRDAPGHVTIRPCGTKVGTSTVNFGAGEVKANGIILPLDAHGRACMDTVGWPDVVIDVVAVDPTLYSSKVVAELEALTPARLFDSRAGSGSVDGEFVGGGPSAAGGTTRLKVAGRGGVPDDAESVVVNVTVVAPTTAGHTTVFACDTDVPNTSTSNVLVGETIANTALVEVSETGEICIATHMSSHLVVDVLAAVYVNPAV